MKPLTINVEKIEDSGQPFEARVPAAELDEVLAGDHPTEFHADGPVEVRARLTKMGKKVLVQARFPVAVVGACKRCLAEVRQQVEVDATLTYVPSEGKPAHAPHAADGAPKAAPKRGKQKKAHDEEGPAASFDLDALDEEHYSGKTIDLAPALREQLLLALPPPPLCKEECKGLCSACGADLNQTDCGHAQKAPDLRWAALKNVRLDAPPKKR